MFTKSSWKHLRIPFSIYLLPVFLFATAVSPEIKFFNWLIVFFSLHLFLYPSSNSYNSYFDKDESSIGGLKHPPKVSKDLYTLSMLFFGAALILGLILSLHYMTMLLIYGLVSMAYSHPSIRLKKFPLLSWLTAGLFQGYYTFAMAYAGINDRGWEVYVEETVSIPGLLTTLMLLGSYPLTQIYQHDEDRKRGDITLSLKLGVMGTFSFSGIWFFLAGAAFWVYFQRMDDEMAGWVFLGAMLPVVLYFFLWFLFVKKDPGKYICYEWAMGMNKISSIFLNAFFLYYTWINHPF
jgi:hypothetical protein